MRRVANKAAMACHGHNARWHAQDIDLIVKTQSRYDSLSDVYKVTAWVCSSVRQLHELRYVACIISTSYHALTA